MVVRAEIRAREHHARHGGLKLISLLYESCTLHSLAGLPLLCVPQLTSGWERNLDPCLNYRSYPCQVWNALNTRRTAHIASYFS